MIWIAVIYIKAALCCAHAGAYTFNTNGARGLSHGCAFLLLAERHMVVGVLKALRTMMQEPAMKSRHSMVIDVNSQAIAVAIATTVRMARISRRFIMQPCPALPSSECAPPDAPVFQSARMGGRIQRYRTS